MYTVVRPAAVSRPRRRSNHGSLIRRARGIQGCFYTTAWITSPRVKCKLEVKRQAMVRALTNQPQNRAEKLAANGDGGTAATSVPTPAPAPTPTTRTHRFAAVTPPS
eukprot:6187484-Pleurochrysis_carterae.AAC.1